MDIKKLNWFGFILTIVLVMLVAVIDRNCGSVGDWLSITTIYGFVPSTLILFLKN